MAASLLTRALPFLALFTPALVSAQGVAQIVGLFNIFVGIMLTVALLTFGTGFVVWYVRLGTWPSYRTEGVKIMEWSVVILFVLVVLLGIVQFFQNHPKAATMVVSVIVMLLVAWGILIVATAKKEKKEE